MIKSQVSQKESANMLGDYVWQGIAAFALVAGLYKEIFDHVNAAGNVRLFLPVLPVSIAVYFLLSPFLRK